MNSENTPRKTPIEGISEELLKKAAKSLEQSKSDSAYKRIREKIERSIKPTSKQA